MPQSRPQTREPAAADRSEATPDAIAPGFLLQLSSSQDQKLNGSFRVRSDGRIELPYDVTIPTKGLTIEGFRSELRKTYKPYFKTPPDIQASIKQRRYWVEIRGMVAKPGSYLVRQDSPLDEIISLASGITEDLAPGFVRVEQNGKTHWIDLDEYFKHGHIENAPSWVGGDRIFFQKERAAPGATSSAAESIGKIQVLGEVKNPGEQTFRGGADGYHYLVKSGGPTSYANLDQVEVVRLTPSSGYHKKISLGPIDKVEKLHDGDILIVHPERPSTLEKTLVITSILVSILSAGLLGYIAVKGTK